jgi:predicted DCC family thiol-disulfide oxidoreductase YuxK
LRREHSRSYLHMPTPEPISVIYDGDCRFCTRALRAIQPFDPHGIVRPYDSHASERIANRFPMLAGVDFDQAMFVVTKQGTVFRGYFAFKEILRRLPLTWPLLLFFYMPGADAVGPRVYAWVARNRRRLGCTTETCDLPTPRSGQPPGAQ